MRQRRFKNILLGASSLLTALWTGAAGAALNYQGSDHYSVSLRPIASDSDNIGTIDKIPYLSVNEYTGKVTSTLPAIGDGLLTVTPSYIAANRQGCYRMVDGPNGTHCDRPIPHSAESTATASFANSNLGVGWHAHFGYLLANPGFSGSTFAKVGLVESSGSFSPFSRDILNYKMDTTKHVTNYSNGQSSTRRYLDRIDEWGIVHPGLLDKHYIDSEHRRIFRDGSTGFPTPTSGSPFVGEAGGENSSGRFYMVTPDGRRITYERRIRESVFNCSRDDGNAYGVCDASGTEFHFDPIRIEDSSGNYVDIEYRVGSDTHVGPPLIERAVDNFGRELDFIYGSGSTYLARIEFKGRNGQLLQASDFDIQPAGNQGVEGDLNLLVSASNQSDETVRFEYTPTRPEGAIYPLIDGVTTPTGGRVEVQYKPVKLERDMFISEGPDCLGVHASFCSMTGPGWYDNVRTYEETYARVSQIAHSGGIYRYGYSQLSTGEVERVISHYKGIKEQNETTLGVLPITALVVRMEQVAGVPRTDGFIRETYYYGPSKVILPSRSDSPYLGKKFFRITVMNGQRNESRRAEQWTYKHVIPRYDASGGPKIGASLGMAEISETFLNSYSYRVFGDCAIGSSQCRSSNSTSPWIDSIYEYPAFSFSDDEGPEKVFPFSNPLSVKLYRRPTHAQLEGPDARLLKKQDFEYRFYAVCDGAPTAFDVSSTSSTQLSCERPERTEEHQPVDAQWVVHDLRGQLLSATETERVLGQLLTTRQMRIQYGNGQQPVHKPVREENFAGPIDGGNLDSSSHWYGREYSYWPANDTRVPRGSVRTTSILGMPDTYATHHSQYDLGRPTEVIGADMHYHSDPDSPSQYGTIQSISRTEYRDDGQVSKSWQRVGSYDSPVEHLFYDIDGRKIASNTATIDGNHWIEPKFSRQILDMTQCQDIISQQAPLNAGGCKVSGRSNGADRYLPWTYSSFTWLNQFGQEVESYKVNLDTNYPEKVSTTFYNAFGLVKAARNDADNHELVVQRYGLNGEPILSEQRSNDGELVKSWVDSFLDGMGNRIVISAQQITRDGTVLPVTGGCSVTDPLGRERFTGTFEVPDLSQVPASECSFLPSARGNNATIKGTQFNYHVCPSGVSPQNSVQCTEILPETQGSQGRRFTVRNLTGQLLMEYHPEFGNDADSDGLNHPTLYRFDAATQLVEVEGPEGHYEMSYSPAGQALAQYDATHSMTSPLTQNVYDERGLLIREINRVSGVATHTGYDELWRANATKVVIPPPPPAASTFSPNRESDLNGAAQIDFIWTERPPSDDLFHHEVHIELRLRDGGSQNFTNGVNFVVVNAETGATNYSLTRADFVREVLAQTEGDAQAALLAAWSAEEGIDGAAHFQWRVRTIYKNEFDTLMPTEISEWQTFGNRFSECDLNFNVTDGINTGPRVEWRALNCPADRDFYFQVLASSVDLGQQSESCAFEDVVFSPGPHGHKRAQFMVYGYGIGTDKNGEPMIVMPDDVPAGATACGAINSASFRLVVKENGTGQELHSTLPQIFSFGGQK